MFGNNNIAYVNRSTWELVRTLAIFYVCRFPTFTDNAVHLMSLSYRVLGKKVSEFLIGKTIYSQFVAGRTSTELSRATERLQQEGIGPILCIPTEGGTGTVPTNDFFDANLEKILGSLLLAEQLKDPFPMFQFRLSALVSVDILKSLSILSEQTASSNDIIQAIIEGMKGSRAQFEQLQGWETFSHQDEFFLSLQRLGKICKAIQNSNVTGLIDAEYTNINPAIRLLTLSLMKECNKKSAKVLFTYQTYLKVTPTILKNDIDFAKQNEICFGLKLVRGAYMIQERMVAAIKKCDDPVHSSFNETSACYHTCLDFLLENIKNQTVPLKVVIASHNEETICHALNRMLELDIDRKSSCVFFAQLYGMADHVSSILGSSGYRVYKSIPYGPISETIPYLARRAQENKSILANKGKQDVEGSYYNFIEGINC
ncbi:Hydroxyproline dehydrogenase [Bulinus truncatus]|nr:Hydroxyproline dehydrogenase [Bulinus truncatus]